MPRDAAGPEENLGDEAHSVLRDGLRRLPVPHTSTDFHLKVHAALSRRSTWSLAIWKPVRQALPLAACSCVATLALLHWLATMPAEPAARSASIHASAVSLNWRRARFYALDRQIERMDLSAGTLRELPAVGLSRRSTTDGRSSAEPSRPRHSASDRGFLTGRMRSA